MPVNAVGDDLRVARSLVSEEPPTVRVSVTNEATETLAFHLAQEGVSGDALSGTVTPGETTVFEVPVEGSLAEAYRLVDSPVRVVVTPIGPTVTTDGGDTAARSRSDDPRFPEVREHTGGGGIEVDRRTEVDRPAVGVLATGTGADIDADGVARAVVGATLRDYPVYVAHDERTDRELLEFCEHLGAELIAVDRPAANGPRVSDALVGSARTDDHRGIILHAPDAASIDYDRSERALDSSDGFAVEAVPEVGQVSCVVGIPAFNEAAAIVEVIDAASAFADEVVVVDDGSSDDTAEVAERAGARVVRHPRNLGYGAALRSVFTEAARLGTETLAVLDADGQHDARDVRRLVEAQRETGADVVIGSRFVEGSVTDMPLYRRFGVEVVNVLTNLAVGRLASGYIRDTQSGFRVYGRRAVESLATDPTIGDGMNASTDIVFHVARHGYTVLEVPTTVRYDVADTSTLNPVSHGLHLVANIVRRAVRERPWRTLGGPAASLTLFGLLVGYLAVSEFVRTGTASPGLVVASVVLLGVGLGAAVAAFVLHATAGRWKPGLRTGRA